MHRIDEMTVTLAKQGAKPRVFTVSTSLAREVEALLTSPGKLSGGIPARHVLPELIDNVQRPAITLRGSRHKEGMTQVALAERLGIRQNHLSDMENGKRAISKSMARKLADLFGCDYRTFL